jgi:CubicO group peptidase (beta-lactamase class C family)
VRRFLALAFLVMSCRPRQDDASARTVPTEPRPDASLVPSASMSVREAPSALAPPAPLSARAVSSREALLAPFRGTNARGFVGMVAVGEPGASSTGRILTPLPAGTNVDLDTPVLVASFTKLWVAVAALRFVERKELSLDDTIADALPDLKRRPWADSTLRELLTHTSRVPEFDEKSGYYSRTTVDFTNPLDVLSKDIPPDWTEKRGVYKYRNAELALVGAILAARGGASAEQILVREVFGPAGMKASGLLVDRAPPGLDLGPMGRVRPQNFFTAGAGYATAADLLSFFEALAGTTLLTEASKATLFGGAAERGYGALGCWAYPFAQGDAGTALVVERPGSFGNVRLFSAFVPAERRAIVAWSREPVDMTKPHARAGISVALTRLLLD